MRVDDPADPAQWSDLQSRIEAVESRWEENQKRNKDRRKRMGNLRFKLSQIGGNAESDHQQWLQISSIIEGLVNDGLPPNNSELRDLLLPKLDDLPDMLNMSVGFRLVLNEVDHFLADRPQPESPRDLLPTKEVTEVTKRLRCHSMVVIGGKNRPASYQSLMEAFRLKELIWIETREHQSIAGFEHFVSDPEVLVVVLAIRWSSHSFGDVKAFCDRYNKPLVRLPGGYNPNQVALQIMKQCSERLPVLPADTEVRT